jgi:hypothetical protein
MSDSAALAHDLLQTFRSQKSCAEGALAQVPDEVFLAPRAGELDPIGVTVKHVGGNLRSRWRDFLTTDGEKDDRNRDGEFELGGDDRAAIMALWEAGWSILFDTLAELETADWSSTVTIRGEPHSVSLAALRSLAHTSYHVGQIVQLAKRSAGADWRTLSIPRGDSGDFQPPQ